MFNFGTTLDTVIALVVVLLVLSFMVQSIQAFIKKIFKLKSKEIEKSLVELFENVMDKPAAIAPVAADAGSLAAPARPPVTPDQLVDKVFEEFKNVGRYTKWGRPVLDSISKEDLLKVLARIDSTYFYADYVTKFQKMYTQVEALEQEIDKLIKGDLLRGVASAKFAELREVLAPLINDIKSISSGNAVKPDVLFGDLINLRRINLEDALNLLSQAQESIARDIQAERQANKADAIAALQELSTVMAKIAGIIGQLGQEADLAFATLRMKLDQVNRWYDTVMQSFEERYTRHMKNFSIYISVAVVILLNASFFNIYRSISTSDQQRDLIVKAGEEWLAEKREKAKPANDGPSNNANANVSGSIDSNSGNSGNDNTEANNDNTAPSPTLDDLKRDVEAIKKYAGSYEGFGFSPLTWNQVSLWSGSFFNGEMFRTHKWWVDRRGDLTHALGWFLMVLLLSVGAPFWQDTLESLFGVKNLLRKKSDTKNVEEGSGQGQPRP